MLRVESAQWRDQVSAAIARGFDMLVTMLAVDDAGVVVWLRLRNSSGVDGVLSVDASHGLESLTELLPGCAWYEREIAEMFGVAFHGHAVTPLLLPEGSAPLMLKSALLETRQSTPWPGEKDPGGVTARRRQLPPGVRA